MKIARYEGVSSLWSGLPPTLLMAVPATVIYFATYETIKREVQRHRVSIESCYRVKLTEDSEILNKSLKNSMTSSRKILE